MSSSSLNTAAPTGQPPPLPGRPAAGCLPPGREGGREGERGRGRRKRGRKGGREEGEKRERRRGGGGGGGGRIGGMRKEEIERREGEGKSRERG